MSRAGRSLLRVVIEAGPLTDGRATAGIGRYVRSLTTALALLDDLAIMLAMPRHPASSERYPLRYLHSQRAVAMSAFGRRPELVHATASEPRAVR